MIIPSVDETTRKLLRKIAIDLLILGSLECLILTSFYFIEPFKRGFFCNDESLMHPYRESTVALSLGYVGFGLPIIVIIMTEFLRWKTNVNETQNIKLFNRDIPTWLVNVYKNFGTFLFGAFVTILITDTGKLVIGRLRPHFMAVCQPIMANGTNCSDQRNIHRYIEDYSCSNTMSTAEKLRDTKLSFPSGHSSFALYTMVYAAFYIHYLMSWTGSKFVKYLLEFIFISLAWFTALSRISDYKHHWSDVLFGSGLGISIALITIYGASDLVARKKADKSRSSILPIVTN